MLPFDGKIIEANEQDLKAQTSEMELLQINTTPEPLECTSLSTSP